jgi:rhodanese-related sulfurtransferase
VFRTGQVSLHGQGIAHPPRKSIAENVKDLLAEANAVVPKLSLTEAGEKIRSGNLLIVDVRDPTEVQESGRLKGAMNVSRGMLEFRADPESQYHDPAFQKDKTILRCWCISRSGVTRRTDREG